MATFLVELGTEELPPKSLKTLALAFEQGILQGLAEQSLAFESSQFFATPRRLAVKITGLLEQQADQQIEKLGPNIKAAFDAEGNPSKAAQGFARGFGIDVSELLHIETDKGTRLGYRSVAKGKSSADLLPEIVKKSLDNLPIPKRMRWGANRAEFIRPVHNLLMMLDQSLIPTTILGIESSTQTFGHRFHANHTIELTSPDDYPEVLKDAYVIADFEQRRQQIQTEVKSIAASANGIACIDEDLLDEVCGLVEWPVPLMGSFETRFLDVPAEALITSMKEHQKYFHLVDADGALLPKFITVSNIESKDETQVISGNERVIRPRLHDAVFFFETDKKSRLEDKTEKLKSIVFQAKLGTIYEKTLRIQGLAVRIGQAIGGDSDKAARAAVLSKSDLVSEMVYEFDALQGIMGYYYALADGEDPEVALAIKEQYLPKGADDELPQSLTGICLALADRIDTLIGIFGIGQQPTGNKDPFALRRASLGIVNICLKHELKLDLKTIFDFAADQFVAQSKQLSAQDELVGKALSYVFERFRAIYNSQGLDTEVFLSVQAKSITSPLDFNRRVMAVNTFAKLDAAASLASANKRVSNILAKFDGDLSSLVLNEALLESGAESELVSAIKQKATKVEPLLAAAQYQEALLELSDLREPIDAFFDQVMVMADDQQIRNNRLSILQQLRELFLSIADISVLAK